MRFRKEIFAFAMAICAVVAFGQTAPKVEWIYTDDYGQPAYSGVELEDTSNLGKLGSTGIGIDSQAEIREIQDMNDTNIMFYFSYDYKFAHGWSGFKMIWEERAFPWDATGYIDQEGTFHYKPFDSLTVTYIGPLPTHKVDIFFGEENIGPYAPAFIDSIGTIPANYYNAPYNSSQWKTVTIPIPPAPAGADRTSIVEIRFLIHNIAGTTSLTSAQGNFSIDRIGLVNANNTGVKLVSNPKSLINNRLFFTPAVGGAVDLSLFSLSGKMLANKRITVIAGKQYSIKQLTSSNLKLSMDQLNVVRISGAGINLQETLR
jgi:hypothetical protein